ncbi:MAG: hydrogenase iron-sulfur subunit [Ideonella sp.]|nr:hydrogenase iron-sulfur subunit [Ideonella sp.]
MLPTPSARTGLREHALALWRQADRVFDAAFGSALNPLRHLGSLGFLCFWLLALSGIYLYVVIDTSADGAWRSIEQLAHQPWYVGGWLRSLHRYAADAFVILMGLHLLREWLHGRYRGFRRFSWWTGVPLIVFAFVSAIGGFWLNWDQLGQFSAQATAEWFDALPLLATPLARNFLTADAVNDRLFSLFVFVHLGVPLLMVFGLWFHIQRITRAAVFPPRALALGSLAVLMALAGVVPVTIHAAANVAVVPTALALDWVLLFVHPLAAATSGGVLWLLVAGSLLLLIALPMLPQPARPAVAVVDPGNCNGCRRCFEDCPYAAVTMVPHPIRRVGKELAVVDPDLCASCGICAGACPSSTPFRSAAELVTGIDMPQLPVGVLRQRLREGLASSPSAQRIVVFGCDHGAPVQRLAGDDLVPISLICSGMLPPSFVEYALRDGAAGVLVNGCCEGACEFRQGQQWAAQRLAGQREPHLRASVPADRLAVAWTDAADTPALDRALNALRQRLEAAPPDRGAALTTEPA